LTSTYRSTNSTHSPPRHLEIVQNSLCALAGAETESVLASPSSHPAPTGAHVAPNRHRTTPQFSLFHQPSLCNLEPQSSRFTSASLLIVAQLMTKRQTQINNTCTKAKIPQRLPPSKTDRQTDRHQPCYRDTSLARRNYKASLLTPLARLITLSCRRPHTPIAKNMRNVSTCDEWPLMMHKFLQQNVLRSIPLSSRRGISFMSRKTFFILEQPQVRPRPHLWFPSEPAVHPPSCGQGCI
jgi:hypothetical protein